jgi:DnaJ domain
MPCACERCLRNSRTLGLPAKPPSKTAVRKAYRAAAKVWHPDRFESNPVKRLEAEEHFKQIQVAYRELWEHCENPEKKPFEGSSNSATGRHAPTYSPPSVFFGDSPGCFAFPHFPPSVVNVIAPHLQETESAVAFIDLSMAGVRKEIGSEYLLLTSHRIIVRDAMSVVSLLWYTDLGEIQLLDRHERKKSGIWQRIVGRAWGIKHRYTLQINRLNGTHFYSIAGQAHDNVKKVVYNFLLQMKQQPRP